MGKEPISVMATHLPLLTRAFDESEGPILEMGTGYFSTLYLDWLCSAFGRKLVSYESGEYWGKRAKRKYESDYHEINVIEDWNDAKIDDTHWGVAFIDHSPKGRRHIDVLRLADKADYIVIHDTEPESERLYHFDKVWWRFKYRFDHKKTRHWTSVVSNFKEVNW